MRELDMTNAETKSCRHCGEPILAVARVCKHCHSSQGWFASQKDPRSQLLILALVFPLVTVPIFLMLRDARAKLNRVVNPDASCRGLVVVMKSSHDVRTIEAHDRLFVRAQVENRSKVDVSDPVIRVEVIGASGNVEDTFIKTVYGANIAPSQPYWLRVDGDLTVEPSTVKEVHATVASADCKSAWR